MANFNMSAIKTIVNNLGIECQLIPSEANPRNCKYILINGKQLKSSQWTKAEAEAILMEYKNGCKPSELAFLTNNENTNNLKELIHFQGSTLTNCLEEYRKLTESSIINSVNNWVEVMTDFFRNDISKRVDIEACANKIKNMIDSKQVILLNNYVYTSYGLKEVIKAWQEANNINTTFNYNSIISKYTKAVEAIL